MGSGGPPPAGGAHPRTSGVVTVIMVKSVDRAAQPQHAQCQWGPPTTVAPKLRQI